MVGRAEREAFNEFLEPLEQTVTVTRNEILTAMNKRDDFVLALVEVDGIAHQPMYLRKPPFRDPGCSEVSVTFDLKGLPTLAERRS